MLSNYGAGEASPLDSKAIKSLNPKGNQTWIFIGRTDAEGEAPILWPPDVKIQLFVTLWTTSRRATLSITNSQSPPKPMSIESVMPSSHLIVPLKFVVKLVWWYWILLTFACLKSFLFLHQLWMRSLSSTVILVVDFSLSVLYICPAIPYGLQCFCWKISC